MAGAIVLETLVQEDMDRGVGEVDKTNPGGGRIRGTRVNLQSFAHVTYSASWTPGSVTGGSFVSTVVTAVGAREGDFVLVTFAGSSMVAGMHAQGRVSDDDSVTVDLHSVTTNNPGTGTLRVMVFKTNL